MQGTRRGVRPWAKGEWGTNLKLIVDALCAVYSETREVCAFSRDNKSPVASELGGLMAAMDDSRAYDFLDSKFE